MVKGSKLGDLKIRRHNKEDVTVYYTWSEVKESKKWIVIRDEVYNVAEFKNRHPGGERILKNSLGQDVTVCLNLII